MLRCIHFSGRDEQVLLWGEPVDLAALSDGLRVQASDSVPSRVDWLPREIDLVIGEPAKGMSRESDRLMWRIARADALRFADLIERLASSVGGGHDYLDVEVDSEFGIEVKVSMGEYPENFASTPPP